MFGLILIPFLIKLVSLKSNPFNGQEVLMSRRVRFAGDLQLQSLGSAPSSSNVDLHNQNSAPMNLDRLPEFVAGAVLAQSRAREAMMQARSVQDDVRYINEARRNVVLHESQRATSNQSSMGDVQFRCIEKSSSLADTGDVQFRGIKKSSSLAEMNDNASSFVSSSIAWFAGVFSVPQEASK